MIVPSRETTVTDIWLDFKYDSGNDGDDIYDPEKFLDITVSIRWNKGDGSPIHVMQKMFALKTDLLMLVGKARLNLSLSQHAEVMRLANLSKSECSTLLTRLKQQKSNV